MLLAKLRIARVFHMRLPQTAHIFCRVIDNFGDIGVCWRLARQMSVEHGIAVTLWVDNLISFRRLCPAIDPAQQEQTVSGISIKHWLANDSAWKQEPVSELVIEAFACDLPLAYVQAMASCKRKPVWINLEYLSAEDWVETCHAMPSPHPSLPLTKYFFFPGFTSATGGLPLERNLFQHRNEYWADGQARQRFLEGLGIPRGREGLLVSLFCYPDAPVTNLFSALAQGTRPVTCLLPEGVAVEPAQRWLQEEARAGAVSTQGKLTVTVIPFLSQPDYDKLLWSCDLNFVRGEDSLVRAQWAGRPFIWQIYPQQDAAHQAKLDAFLTLYTRSLPHELASRVVAASQAWNKIESQALGWPDFLDALPELQDHTLQWGQRLRDNGDLLSKLLRFAGKIG